MQARTSSKDNRHSSAARLFFSDFANTTPFFKATPHLQTKGNDDEFELTEKLTLTAVPEPALLGVAEAPAPPPPDDTPSDPSSSASTPAVQTKLTVGPADDHFEREADAIADRIVGGSDAPITTPLHPGASLVQRQTPDEEAEETETQETLQTKGSTEGEAPEAVQDGLEQNRGLGSALPSSTQGTMEESFGVKFSDMRVHTDVNAQAMNQELNARAFTYGSDIYFNAGEYRWTSTL